MSKKKVGICFGCFIPLHAGHIKMIYQAIDENDEVILAVTGHDFDRGKDFVPFLRRVDIIHTVFSRNYCNVVRVDDKAIGLTGTFSSEAWLKWCNELFNQAKADPNDAEIEYTWYMGEQDYIDKIQAHYPDHKFVKLDRDMIAISGTEIRENPKKYEDQIHWSFVNYLRTQGILN